MQEKVFFFESKWNLKKQKNTFFAKKSTFFYKKKVTFFLQKKVLFFAKKKYFSSYDKSRW